MHAGNTRHGRNGLKRFSTQGHAFCFLIIRIPQTLQYGFGY